MSNPSKLTLSYTTTGFFVFLCAAAAIAAAQPLSGQELLVTFIRTGDTEILISDPATGDFRMLK